MHRRYTSEQRYLHGGSIDLRNRFERNLRIIGWSDQTEEAWCTCGANAWVLRDLETPGRYKVAANSCHHRWCPRCSRLRAAKIRSNLNPHLDGKTLRMVTLTLVSTTEPLAELCQRITRCFAELRRVKLWKAAFTGGVRFIEVKRNRDVGRWHVHLHLLTEGTYCPQAALSSAWHGVTGDSQIVDIRMVRDSGAAMFYVTKYCTKVIDKSVWEHDDRLYEAILALKGVRLVDAFGSWRGLKLMQSIESGDWVVVGRLETFLAANKDDAPLSCLLKHLLQGVEQCQIPPPLLEALARDSHCQST